MSWAGGVAGMGKINSRRFRSHLGGIGVDKRIILKCIFNKYGLKVYSGFKWLRIGSNGRLL
jgi:hypothetical protein